MAVSVIVAVSDFSGVLWTDRADLMYMKTLFPDVIGTALMMHLSSYLARNRQSGLKPIVDRSLFCKYTLGVPVRQ